MTASCDISAAPAKNPDQPAAIFGAEPFNTQGFSLFRIFMALLLLCDYFHNILPSREFLFSREGVMTATERKSDIMWALLNYSDHPTFINIFFSIYVIALFCLLIGYKSRLCAFIAFLFFTSINERNPVTMSNADVLIGCLLLWASFLPLDRYWSVASALRDQENRRTVWPVIPLLAMKTQIMVVYLYSGLFKLGSTQWIEGDAVRQVVHDNFYATYLGYQIVSSLPDGVTTFLAISVIFFQIAFSFMIYFPFYNNFFRAIAILGAIGMHLGFVFLLQVHLFPYLCFTYLVLLIPDSWFDKLLHKRRERLSSIRIFYDPDCGFCRAVALLFREFCLPATVKVRPAHEDATALELLHKHTSWVVFGNDGKTYLKWEAVAYVMRQSPLFWIFGYLTDLTLIKKPMRAAYDVIGDNRHLLGKIAGPFLKPDPERYPDAPLQWICLFLVVVMVSCATLTLPQSKEKVPEALHIVGRQTNVAQTWNLFAPVVASATLKLEVNGLDDNDNYVDLSQYLNKHYTIDHGYFTFANHRVLKFYIGMYDENNPRHREGYARYFCLKTLREGKPLAKVHMKFYQNAHYTNNGEPLEWDITYGCPILLKKYSEIPY